MNMKTEQLNWYRVADSDELPAGRVKTVTVGTHSMALTHIDGKFTAMDNRCPHQGGPLGEGSIEVGTDGQCWLRCPWHGWDFDPKTGLSPGGHESEALSNRRPRRRYLCGPQSRGAAHDDDRRCHGRNHDELGRDHRVWHGWARQPGSCRCPAIAGKQGTLEILRYPTRGCGSVRLFRVRQTHRETGCVSDHRRTRRYKPHDRPVGRGKSTGRQSLR